MITVRKIASEIAVQYNGYNFHELKKQLEDNAGQIQYYIDRMLKVDTQHGRLAVRIEEWIVKNGIDCYQVYSNDEFKALFEEV